MVAKGKGQLCVPDWGNSTESWMTAPVREVAEVSADS